MLFEWHSLEHVGLDETYARVSQDGSPGIDYFHVNFIEVDHDSNLIVSARETFAVCTIDRKTGEVMWRLGGKKSDFEMGPGTRFAYQHDARRQRDGTISIFDNGTTVFHGKVPEAVEESRAIVLELDEERMRASLVPREGFETALLARTAEPYVAVCAKHSSGRILGTSKFIEPGSEAVLSRFSCVAICCPYPTRA